MSILLHKKTEIIYNDNAYNLPDPAILFYNAGRNILISNTIFTIIYILPSIKV